MLATPPLAAQVLALSSLHVGLATGLATSFAPARRCHTAHSPHRFGSPRDGRDQPMHQLGHRPRRLVHSSSMLPRSVLAKPLSAAQVLALSSPHVGLATGHAASFAPARCCHTACSPHRLWHLKRWPSSTCTSAWPLASPPPSIQLDAASQPSRHVAFGSSRDKCDQPRRDQPMHRLAHWPRRLVRSSSMLPHSMLATPPWQFKYWL